MLNQLEQLPSDGADLKTGNPLAITSRIKSIKVALDFINKIHGAMLDNAGLDVNVLDPLCNPPEEQGDISNPNVCLSLDLFLAVTNASEEIYNLCHSAILHCYSSTNILLYYLVKKLVSEITGVIAVYDDMCINSCHAFMGPFSQHNSCTICGEAQYNMVQLASTDKKVPCQQFCMILLSPQLQALCQSHTGATNMWYLDQKLKDVMKMLENLQMDNGSNIIYNNILCGSEAQDLADRVAITAYDTLVLCSLDGAQLYQNMKSDTWLSIWVIHNFSLDSRYQKQHVFPGTIIPGPNKLKITDSYLY